MKKACIYDHDLLVTTYDLLVTAMLLQDQEKALHMKFLLITRTRNQAGLPSGKRDGE
jgi:hypothetical protein